MANKDTEEAKKEIERLAKEQSKKEAKETKQSKKEAERLAKEEAKKKAEDEKRFKEAEAKAHKEAQKLAKEQTKKEAKETKQAKQAKEAPAPDVSSATYEGKYQLVLPSAVGFKQVKQFTQRLAEIEGVEVVWTGGSLDEGTLITVSVAQGTPLARILGKMPMVGGVEVKGDKITVTFEASV